MTDTYEPIRFNVIAKAKLSEAGVSLGLTYKSGDWFYVLWAIRDDGSITEELLDASVTDEARLLAHAEGFRDNVTYRTEA